VPFFIFAIVATAKNKKYFYGAHNALSHSSVDIGSGLPMVAKMMLMVGCFG
jgi:hypothetical protein